MPNDCSAKFCCSSSLKKAGGFDCDEDIPLGRARVRLDERKLTISLMSGLRYKEVEGRANEDIHRE